VGGKRSLFPLLDWLLCGDELCIFIAAEEHTVPRTWGDIPHLAPCKAPVEMLQEGTREQQQQPGQAGVGSEGGKHGGTVHGGFYVS